MQPIPIWKLKKSWGTLLSHRPDVRRVRMPLLESVINNVVFARFRIEAEFAGQMRFVGNRFDADEVFAGYERLLV